MMTHYIFDTCHRLIRESCAPTNVNVHPRSRMTHSVIINNLRLFLSFRRLSAEVSQPKAFQRLSLNRRLSAEDFLRTRLWTEGSLPKTLRGLVSGSKASRRLISGSKAFGVSFIVSRMKLLLFYPSSQIRALQECIIILIMCNTCYHKNDKMTVLSSIDLIGLCL